MVNQLWVMIEGRGDLLSSRWSCHYLMNNEPFQPSIRIHTHTNHFTFSLHPSISSSWLFFTHDQMAFTVPPCAKRQEYFCLSMPSAYSVKAQLHEICNMMNWHHNIIIQNNKKANQELSNIYTGLSEHHLGVQANTEENLRHFYA